MAHSHVGIVTGANKGIGLAIVRELALQFSRSPLYNGSDDHLLIYLTARDQSRGENALEELMTSDSALREARVLRRDGGAAEMQFHQLDITDTGSLSMFVDDLGRKHPDGLDFVVNNAGIAMRGFDSNVVQTTLDCNYYKTLAACHAFLPLLKPQGRLVNVASISGLLHNYSASVRDRFVKSVTEADVTSIMEDFAAAVAAGKEKEEGFPSAAYTVSKAGLIGATRALAKADGESGQQHLINSCCPGWVVTDMTRGAGHKTPAQGAQTPVMLAIHDVRGITGRFWQDEREVKWAVS